MRYEKIQGFILISFFLIVSCATAAEKIPSPPYTGKVRSERTKLMGGDFVLTIYNSDLPFENITKFYKDNLEKSGWQEVSFQGKDGQAVTLRALTSYRMMTFYRDDRMISIQYLPVSSTSDKVSFSVAEGKVPFLENGRFTSLPESKEPLPEDFPLYPGSKILPGMPNVTSLGRQWAVTTSAGVLEVIDFYKANMPSQGWELQDESPLESHEISEEDLSIYENCPNCGNISSDIKDKIRGSTSQMAALRYKKGKRVCMIAVIETGPPSKGKTTLISVSFK